jgi:hypothetical protein
MPTAELLQVESPGRGWASFLIWAATGMAVAFSVIAAASVGLFVMPFALVLVIWAARQSRHPAEAVGLVVGCGLVLIVIGLVHRDDVPCGSSGHLSARAGEQVSCGGFDATPWLATGAAAVAFGLVAYSAHSLRSSRRASG